MLEIVSDRKTTSGNLSFTSVESEFCPREKDLYCDGLHADRSGTHELSFAVASPVAFDPFDAPSGDTSSTRELVEDRFYSG